MKVLLDMALLGAAANPHQRGTMGIFRVVEHLAHALVKAKDTEAYFAANHNWIASRQYFEKHLTNGELGSRSHFVQPALCRAVIEPLARLEKFLSECYVRPPWNRFGIGRALWAAGRRPFRDIAELTAAEMDIFHAPGGEIPQWTRRFKKLRRFATLYDIMPLIHPELFPAGSIRFLKRVVRSISPDDWVLCISESTRHDLLEYPGNRCDPDHVLVTPLAAESIFHPENDSEKIASLRARYGIPAEVPYFLSVSTFEPRKNLDTLIRAFCDLVRANPLSRISLVLVGGARWDVRTAPAAFLEAGALQERIILTGYVADEDLAALYSGATGFVYVSLYEGFGLPPLEAMQSGLPVIVSNTSSLPEVVGNAGILVPPTDRGAITEAMRQLFTDALLRKRLTAAGIEQARLFSWEKFENQVLTAYRTALN